MTTFAYDPEALRAAGRFFQRSSEAAEHARTALGAGVPADLFGSVPAAGGLHGAVDAALARHLRTTAQAGAGFASAGERAGAAAVLGDDATVATALAAGAP